ncbi:Na/Pi cotransporter family protein [Helicobacter sp. 23-1048]
MLGKFSKAIKQYYFFVIGILVIYALAVNEEIGKLCAGVAILLFGMLFLGEGFRGFSGGILERVLSSWTKTPIRSVAFGTIATTIMQSSSIVTVLAVTFAGVSLITVTQGIGVMFGANLGNSAGSWLIVGASSISISALALPFIVGGLLFNFRPSKAQKYFGKILAGFGFFFLGVFYIKAGFEGFKEVMDLSQYRLEGYKEVFGFLLIGAAMTAIIQSSHGSLAIIIAAYAEQQISYSGALAAVLGTSVGGVVTALVASLGTNVEGRRLAVANCVFNFTTVFIVAVFFPYFEALNNMVGDLCGFAEDSMFRIAIWHTLFNLVGVVLLTAFIPLIAKILNSLLKSKSKSQDAPLYINDALLPYRDTAIEALTKEVKHLYDNAFAIISHAIGFHRTDIKSDKELKEVVKNKDWLKEDIDVNELYNNQVKTLFNSVMDFSSKLQTFVSDIGHIEQITALQIASRKIAEATKSAGVLRANIKKYSTGRNAAMQKEYDEMRLEVGSLLRLIEQIKIAPKKRQKKAKNMLKDYKKFFKAQDRNAFGIVERLIQQKAISSANGTSLLNDISFIDNIAKELISVANNMYGLVDVNVKKKKGKNKHSTLVEWNLKM